MSKAHAEVSVRPVAGRGRLFLLVLWTVALLCGAAALVLAWTGWTLRLGQPQDVWGWADLAVRTVKVLLLSDIYYDTEFTARQLAWFEPARVLGVLFSLIVALRLIALAIGAQLSDLVYRLFISRHDVIIGEGQAAREYAAGHGHMFDCRAIHLAEVSQPTARRLATLERRGPLKAQLRHAKARRARRIVVDEGDDADTWQTAQLAAAVCPKAEVLAHIADPWMRDRLSRDRSSTERATPKLSPFSYAGGAARQVMLAHPPYLLAQAIGSATQHILVIGFGQVGESILREFLLTSVISADNKMMVTVVDPSAATLEDDFAGRHEELGRHADIAFIAGDFRIATTRPDGLFEQLRKRIAKAPICAAYVAVPASAEPMGLAFAVRAHALRHSLFTAPVFVCAQHGAGLPPVRHGAGLVGGPADVQEEREKQAVAEGKLCNLRVVSFGAWPAAFDGAGLFEYPYDSQARRYHEEYSRNFANAERARTGSITTGVKSWENLPDQLRVANRRAAAHMRAKAFVAGFDLARWLAAEKDGRHCHELPPAAGVFPPPGETSLALARLEHQRWMLDRLLDGWRSGGRSDYYRTRPTLVPFDQLGDEDVAKDNSVVETTRGLMKEAASRKKKR